MKSIYLIVLTLLLSASSFAQNKITGTIADSKSHAPLQGVSIFIPELNKGSVSTENGTFELDQLPSKVITVQFTLIGYKSIVQSFNPSLKSTISIELLASSTNLDEVLVTSGNKKLSKYSPFPVSSISQNDIRKYASHSVMGNLSYQPGIDKISIGNGISKPVLRGLSFNQIMLYGQGTRIENQQWDDHHDLGLSDVGISHVEIVRGPAALIYGADALGGALIFVDDKPAPAGTKKGEANLGFYSNTLGFNGDVGISGSNKSGLFYGVRLGGASHTSYVQGEGEEENPSAEEEEFAANSKMMNAVAKANIGVSKSWGSSKFSYSFFNQQIGIIEDESKATNAATEDEGEQRDREMEAPYQDVSTHILSSENVFFTGKSKVGLNVAYQLNDRKEYEPLANKQKELAIGLKLNTVTYDAKWTSNDEKALGVTIGSQGYFSNNTNNGKESLVPDADISDVAGYGIVHYDHANFNLMAGARFDARSIEAESYEKNEGVEADTFIMLHTNDTVIKPEVELEKEYAPISFSIGAAYHFNDHLSVKLNAATGFTAPNYAQLGTFGKHEGTYRFERGKMNLDVEQNTEGDLGLEWDNEMITINANAYLNKIKNYIYIQNTGDSIVRSTPDVRDTLALYDYKQGDATISGGELGIDFHPSSAKWIDVKLSYSLIDGTLDAGGSLPYIPSNKTVGEIKLMKSKLWRLNNSFVSFVVSNYEQRTKAAEYELVSSAYTLLDVYLGASFKLGKQDVSFNLFCTNLTNKGYYNQLSLVKYIGVRDMGRNIGVQLHIPFGL